MDRPTEPEFAWLMFVGILLMFLLSMAVVAFFVFYQRKLHGQQTAMERLKLEEQKKLLQAEITAQENERARIARDLHDEVGVLLSTAKLYMTMCRPLEEKIKQLHLNAENLLDEGVLKLRSIAQNLLPENLRLFGLVSAIERNCWQMEEAGVFSVQFNHHLEKRLPEEVEIHVYRIVQEILNNAIKHAQATQIKLSLQQQSYSITLIYEDNGVGFLPDKPRKEVGLGLTTLSSRVQMLQGEMLLQSALGEGVHITINFPIFVT